MIYLYINILLGLGIFILSFVLNAKSKSNLGILALSPHITELVYEAGAEIYLAGKTSASDYPIEANKIPIIADYKNLYIEEILNLKKNYNTIIALSWQEGNPYTWQILLKKYNIKTIWLPSKTTQDVAQSLAIISNLSKLYDNNYSAKKAEDNIKQVQNIIFSLQHKAKINQQKIKIYFYPIWWQPLMTNIGNNYTDNLLSLCHTQNFYHNNLTMNLNLESVLTNNFDILFYEQDKILPNLSNKIKAKSRIAIEGDILLRPTTRSIVNIVKVCNNIRLN